MRGICSVDDCDLPVVGWGWCSKHYYRWKRHGSTDNPSPSIEERFWAKVIKTKTCWTYTGGLNRGYGQFWLNDKGRGIPAHVYAYRLLVDPTNTADLDHLCHTFDPVCPGGADCPHRACVNPAHLQPVTRGQNSSRGAWRKTTCKRGHEFTEENTRITKQGHRACRICDRERVSAYDQTEKGRVARERRNLVKRLRRAEAKVAALRAES